MVCAPLIETSASVFCFVAQDGKSLVGEMGVNMGSQLLGRKPVECADDNWINTNHKCAKWPKAGIKLKLRKDSAFCTTVEWEGNLKVGIKA